jgi:dienelactone hydrolase
MRLRKCIFLTIVCACFARARAADEQPAVFNTIDDLWSGFDPRALPLEVEVIKAWDEGDVHLETIYFTGEVFEGEKTRVFGYLGRPRNVAGKTPGILHIHGGGQTANLDWPRFWARRGYISFSFDFCGNTNLPTLGPEYRRERYTLWGKVPANMMEVSGGRAMKPTPRYNPWYHWNMAARRGLTLLEAQPGIDAERLGIFGISMGGTLTWMVAAVDPRVKAAVPIYGNGWESYSAYPPQTEPEVSEDNRLWRALIAPETHAPRISCPVLFMSATDDFHGKMDLGYRTLDLLGSPVRRQVFTPNYDHHIEPAEARSLPLWMDVHLRGTPAEWPAAPQIMFTAAGANGVPRLRVTAAAEADPVTRVDIYYALSNDWPMTRFWRTVESVQPVDEGWMGSAAYLDASDVLTAFANVTYASGIRQSSRLARQPAAEIAGARATLVRSALVDAMDTATDWNWVPAYTDPNQGDTVFFAPWIGADGERGFTLDPKMFPHERATSYYFGTRKIGDPQFRGQGDAVLAIDYPADREPDKLTIRVRHRLPGEHSQEFETALLPRPESEDTPSAVTASPDATQIDTTPWRTLQLEVVQFHNAQGVVLPDWEHVEYFILQGTNVAGRPPVFKRLRWEPKR